MARAYNVLFLCTGNSARAILTEAILNHKGKPNFHAYSAGSHPAGRVRLCAIRQLESAGLPSAGLGSKNWGEFSKPPAPVRDNAAKEICPIWPGQPMTAHWGISDPVAAGGSSR